MLIQETYTFQEYQHTLVNGIESHTTKQGKLQFVNTVEKPSSYTLQRSNLIQYGPLGKILPFTGLRKLNLTFHLWSDMSREEQRAAKAELKAKLGVFFIAYKKNFTKFKKVITKIGL
jgi:hypothetical protein